jgi:hypothetical protein
MEKSKRKNGVGPSVTTKKNFATPAGKILGGPARPNAIANQELSKILCVLAFSR